MLKQLILLLILATTPLVADSIPLGIYQNQGNAITMLGPDLSPAVAPTFHGYPALGDVLCFAWTFTSDQAKPIPWEALVTIGGASYEMSGFLTGIIPGYQYTVQSEVDNLLAYYHGAEGTISLSFAGFHEQDHFQYFTPVPEPATLSLMGIGTLMIGAIKRRAWLHRP